MKKITVERTAIELSGFNSRVECDEPTTVLIISVSLIFYCRLNFASQISAPMERRSDSMFIQLDARLQFAQQNLRNPKTRSFAPDFLFS